MCPALKISGVYLVTCGRGDALPVYYVGQTRDFARRTKEHLYALRHGKHSNRRLQNTYNAYGVVSIEMLEPCATDELNDAEQWWIDEMHGHRRVANAAVEARSNRGYKKTDAARRAQSERQRGQNNPMFGKPWSTERRAEPLLWYGAHRCRKSKDERQRGGTTAGGKSKDSCGVARKASATRGDSKATCVSPDQTRYLRIARRLRHDFQQPSGRRASGVSQSARSGMLQRAAKVAPGLHMELGE